MASQSLPIQDSTERKFATELYWIGAGGIACTAINNLQSLFLKDTMFLIPYWFGFYVTSYADGFRRRALVGSILRLLFPHGLSVYIINGLGLFCLLSCLTALLWALVRLCSNTTSLRARLFFFALCASSLSGVFSEVTGDMCQVAFTLFFAVNLLAGRRLRNQHIRLGLALATIVICFFIHESTICYLLPALPFMLKPWPRVRDFVLPCLLYGVLMALALHVSTMDAHPAYPAILRDNTLWFQNRWAMVAMDGSISAQHRIFIASKQYMAMSIARLSLLIFCSFVAFAHGFNRHTFERTLLAFSVIFILSLPIFIMAQDWGRFLVYVFLITLVSSGLWAGAISSAPTKAPRPIVRLADGLRAISRTDLVQLGVAFVLLNSANPWMTHFYGLDERATKNFCILACMALLAWLYQRTIGSRGHA